MNILLIPDPQCKDGNNTDHLKSAGRYIVKHKPDVIVHLGDHFDMESLSTYADRQEMEGRRVLKDIQAGKDAMADLLAPLNRYNRTRQQYKEKMYRPRMEFLLGNHEYRLARYICNNPQIDGIMRYPESFGIEDYGWAVNDFLHPININGFVFSHYFCAEGTGRAIGGTGHNKLNKIKNSFVQGHKQGLDIALATGQDGSQYLGITAGSFYQHDEGYIGPQLNHHFRGLVMMRDVKDGFADIETINIKRLMEEY